MYRCDAMRPVQRSCCAHAGVGSPCCCPILTLTRRCALPMQDVRPESRLRLNFFNNGEKRRPSGHCSLSTIGQPHAERAVRIRGAWQPAGTHLQTLEKLSLTRRSELSCAWSVGCHLLRNDDHRLRSPFFGPQFSGSVAKVVSKQCARILYS